MTNKKFISDLMTFSDNGILSELFVLKALTYYTENVLSQKDKLLKEEEENQKKGKVSFISMKGWVRTAEEIDRKLTAHRGELKKEPEVKADVFGVCGDCRKTFDIASNKFDFTCDPCYEEKEN